MQERKGEMERANNLVGDLQKNHRELSSLVVSFQRALTASDRKEAREILDKIDDMASGHFKFEEGYLYPRMRRLMLEMIEKLCNGQEAIKGFIRETRGSLKKDRMDKNRLSDLSRIIPMISRHVEDCNDLVRLADKFGEEEGSELNQKFKACCEIKRK